LNCALRITLPHRRFNNAAPATGLDPTSSEAGLPGRITDGNDAPQYIFPAIFVPRDIPKRSKTPIVAQISRLPGDQIKKLRGMENADQQNV
jgi:hypothetical protein